MIEPERGACEEVAGYRSHGRRRSPLQESAGIRSPESDLEQFNRSGWLARSPGMEAGNQLSGPRV